MRATLREAMASTIAHGDLQQNPLIETGADRMGALGLSDELGAAMWRVTCDHDKHAFIAAEALLAKRLQTHRRESPSLLRRLAAVVIREWLDNKCRACSGRGFKIHHASVTHVCPLCQGLTTRRHSDTERIRHLGIPARAYPKWEKRFADAHGLISKANDDVRRQCARQLWRPARAAIED